MRWAHVLSAGSVRIYPFAKLYAITGTGLGMSGGVAVERWSDLWVMRSASYANWVNNTAGKGDHRHMDEIEAPYMFSNLETLQADFWAAVNTRRKRK